MAIPTISINNSTGSDTAASGAGPGTAISGTGASLDGTTTVDLSADTPDLSGVAADDVLWCDTTSGLQWSKIVSVDDGLDTVTVATAYSVTEGSRNWGIGGKRLTFEGIRLLLTADILPGWIIDVEHTGTDYTYTSVLATAIDGDTTDGRITLKSSSTTRPTINADVVGNANYMFGFNTSHWLLEHLVFDHINTGRALIGLITVDVDGNNFTIRDCEITEESFAGTKATYLIEAALNTNDTQFLLTNCWLHHSRGGLKAGFVQKHTTARIENCLFEDLTEYCILLDDVEGPLIYRNEIIGGTYGIYMTGFVKAADILNNVIVDATNDGIILNGAAVYGASIMGNIIHGNGGYGVNVDTLPNNMNFCDFNAFRSNTSGEVTGVDSGAGNVTLTADPFTNAAGGDYTLNSTAGGGAACKAVGGPVGVGLVTATRTNNVDIGAHQSAAGGGAAQLINGGGLIS